MHEAGAAIVAAQLLAFYREPVRYRPRLTHGREAFPGGMSVFRFAQGKFPHALLRDLSVQERERVREAAKFFIRQVCLWDGATHYQLLCVPAAAHREAIKEHYHGLMALIHPDRQEGESDHWPSGSAQRVNRAYAVLSDDALRGEYDASLQKSAGGPASLEESVSQHPHTAAVHAPVRGRVAAARIRLRKPVLLVSVALATLFFLQVWWASEVPREYSILSNAAPLDLSSKWMRDAFSSAERPRFMGAGDSPAMRSDAKPSDNAASGESVPFLSPLWAALSERMSRTRAAPAPTLSGPALAKSEVPTREIDVPERVQLEPRAPMETSDGRPQRQPPQAVPTAPTVQPKQPTQPAQPEAAGRVNSSIAQAAEAKSAADASISGLDMETLVARLVTYYEAGDLDRLLGLYDAASIGVWEAVRLRHDFQEFFRATKTRRLRLHKVSWETSAQTARARGRATLVADYHDEPSRVERDLSLEVDVTMRDGQPRIARLSLFPHVR